jgi:hypothetical protein
MEAIEKDNFRNSLKLYVFDNHFTLRCYFEPVSINKQINPRAMYVLLHNRHIYKLDKNIKQLEIRVLDKKTKMDELVSVPSNHYHIIEHDEKNGTPVLINSYDDLLAIINNNKEPYRSFTITIHVWICIKDCGRVNTSRLCGHNPIVKSHSINSYCISIKNAYASMF